MRTPYYIAFAEQSDLSEFKELSLTQLHQRTWALSERSVHPALYELILRAAAQEAVKPRSVHHFLTAEEAAHELYAGTSEAAFLTRAGAWRIARNGLTMRPLTHPELSLSEKLIARSDDSSRLVSEFARALKRKLETPQRTQLSLPLNERRAS